MSLRDASVLASTPAHSLIAAAVGGSHLQLIGGRQPQEPHTLLKSVEGLQV